MSEWILITRLIVVKQFKLEIQLVGIELTDFSEGWNVRKTL